MNNMDAFAFVLKHRYGLTPDQVTPSDVPSVWVVKEPCPGGAKCRHAFRIALGPCEGGGRLTIAYYDEPRDKRGRWASPYRTWRAARVARQDELRPQREE